MHKPHKHNVEQKKPDTEEYIPNDSVYLNYKRSKTDCQEGGLPSLGIGTEKGHKRSLCGNWSCFVSCSGGWLYRCHHFVNIHQDVHIIYVNFSVCIMYLNKTF